MKDLIKEHGINRLVVAACTPKTHEGIFMDTLQACGVNKYLFEMANIRNQDSWIHSDDPEGATVKAKKLVQMAVARATTLHPLQEKKISVNIGYSTRVGHRWRCFRDECRPWISGAGF